MPQAPTRLLLPVLLLVSAATSQAQTNTTLLVDIDHRPATSLNGDWHVIVDQYATGLYTFHQELRKDGFFMNAPFDPSGNPQDYNFANASTLKVPGDWNTQRPDLFYYEGVVWYQKDFQHTAQPKMESARERLRAGLGLLRGFAQSSGAERFFIFQRKVQTVDVIRSRLSRNFDYFRNQR